MNERLATQLRKLRLSGLKQSLDVRLHEAAVHQLSHLEFLELILQDEMAIRHDRQLARNTRAAEFRNLKSLDQFDFQFNPSIDKRKIFDLATCRFLREHKDILWLGPPGTGKTFLATAIGYQAIKAGHLVYYRSIFDVVRDFMQQDAIPDDRMLARYLKPDLLIIDDFGMKQLPLRSGECLFEIVLRRHQVKSTMMTSNRPIEDWGHMLHDVPSASAILDRFLHHAEVVQITGRSYRLSNRTADSEPSNDSEERDS